MKALRIWIYLWLSAFLPRFIFLWISSPSDPSSWSHYWNLSTGLLRFGTFGYAGERVTNVEPGYPILLAVLRLLTRDQLFWVLTGQIILTSFGAVLIFELLRKFRIQKSLSILGALLYSFYPYLIGQASSVIEVSILSTLLILNSVCYLQAWQHKKGFYALVCGLSFLATIYIRMMVLPAVAASVLVFLFHGRWKTFAYVTFICVLGLLPWFLRNAHIDGSFIPPRSGWNLIQGNCPYSDRIIPSYNPDLLGSYVTKLLEKERPDLVTAPDRESLGREVDDFLSAKSFQFMRENPWETVWLRLKFAFYLFYPRIVPFYSMDESTHIEWIGDRDFRVVGIPDRGFWRETAHSLAYGFILFMGIFGMLKRRKITPEESFFYFLLINFTLVYAFYWPATRLRAPIDFIFMIYTAFALESFFNRKALHRVSE